MYSLKSTPTAFRTMTKILLSVLSSFLCRRALVSGDVRVTAQADELSRELGDGQRVIHDAGIDRAMRHAAKLRRPRVLCEGDAVFRFDRFEPFGPVGSVPRENHADRLTTAIAGEGAEEEVDGQMELASLVVAREKRQTTVKNPELRIGRDYVHVIGLDALTILGLTNRHRRRLRQGLRQKARVRGIQVLDQDKRHPGIGRQRLQELGECLEPACGRANANDGEGAAVLSDLDGPVPDARSPSVSSDVLRAFSLNPT